jgi:bifunctional DNase/RNase
MIQCELVKIMITETADPQVIVLKEVGGERAFPILIGISEAIAIDRKIKGYEPARPLTHDLLASVLTGLGGQLDRIEVCGLQESTFFAKLVVSRDGEVVEVDARPSDAIALAVRLEAPIFVAEEVINEVCQ